VTVALGLVLLVMAAVNVWVHVGPRRVHPVTGPVAAGMLLLIGRAAGLSWEAMGLGGAALARGARWGAVAAGLVAAGYAVAAMIPGAHRFFRDTRYRLGLWPAVYTAFVAVPLGTVVFEEVAFRGVLWGLVEDANGAAAATVVTSILFGLWHVLPALASARSNEALGPSGPGSGLGRTVLATVAFTTVAGVVFAELRRYTGSLLAPVLLHWAANGIGVLVAARLWATGSREPGG
jgi:CAAX protease family protein